MNKRLLLITGASIVIVAGIGLMNWIKSPSAKVADAQQPLVTPTTTNGYVSIPELGIRIKTPSAIQDLVYLNEDADGPSAAAIKLSTKSLTDQAKKTDNDRCSAQGQGLGSIIKTNQGPITVPHVEKMVSGSIIAYAYPQSTCSDDTQIKQLQSEQVEALKQAIQTAEPL
jgi:hypothetical protein